MTHFPILVIIPHDIYNQGEEAILTYIDKLLKPYGTDFEYPPRIKWTSDELLEAYLNYGKQYSSVEDYADAMEYKLDDGGNVITTENPDAFYDYYEVGGRWDKLLTTGKYGNGNNELKDNIVPALDVLKIYNGYSDPTNLFEPQVVFDEDEMINDRESLFLDIIVRNEDNYMVLLDAHI